MKPLQLSVLLSSITTPFAHALVFPLPANAPYQVQWTSTELVDANRPDPYNASHSRRIMFSQFTPISKGDCLKTCHVPYMSSFMGSVEEAIFDAFLGDDIGWPKGLLADLELEVCCKVRKHSSSNKPTHNKNHRTIIYDTGLNTTRLLYSAAAQNLAATRGYEVIVVDHPYDTDAVVFPDGSVIYGGRVPRDPEALEELAYALDARTQDAKMVLDYLGVPGGGPPSSSSRGSEGHKFGKVGFVGDSFGGPAAADAMLKDARVVAGVNMDGIMFGPAVDVGVAGPFLTFGTPEHNSTTEPTWTPFFNASVAQDAWIKELSVADSVHGLLIDFGLMGDVAGLRGEGSKLVGLVFGKITGQRTLEILSAYLSSFFDFALEGKGEGLLGGPSEEYPEISFIPLAA
ncbi:uncharacterized protein C8A04DRAFT_24124 [Dichotomopilus funicola]|uniref:1-alkyl-2-acetylglycerophosphocholine esterase n=1 Tax=Dichotomopilus funicola TaxID=1934379 RepID=A0AAN6VBN1_9PEZI|nr:hypothetical protein C8A04DRAFT_24124 [Dichotomopilus funicola]